MSSSANENWIRCNQGVQVRNLGQVITHGPTEYAGVIYNPLSPDRKDHAGLCIPDYIHTYTLGFNPGKWEKNVLFIYLF